MNFLYLKYFCDAVRLGGVTASSKANFVTQSAISQGIGKLEKSLGCALLARHPNRFRLTPEGQRAYPQMVEILRGVAEFQASFFEDRVIGNLEFACSHSFAIAVIPPYLKRFRTTYPYAKIHFSCMGIPADIKRMLKMGTIDFGITCNMGDFAGFEKRILYQGKYGLYISRNIKPRDEKKLGFILPTPEETTPFKEAYANKYGKEPEVFLSAGSWEAVANLALEGLGIGYFPDYIARHKQELRQCEKKLQLPDFQICAVYPAKMKLQKSSETFLSYFLN